MKTMLIIAIVVACLALAAVLGVLAYSYVLQIRNLMEYGKFLRERLAAVPGGELRWRKAFDQLLTLGVEAIEKVVSEGRDLMED